MTFPSQKFPSVPLYCLGDDIPELYYEELQEILKRLVFIYTASPGKASTAEQESPHIFGLCPPEINTTEVYCLVKKDH